MRTVSTKIKKLIPMLYTRNLKATIDFYVNAIGFKCNSSDAGWASLSNGEVEIMVSLPNLHITFDKPDFTGSFYFHTENVDEIWERLKEKAKIVYPVENFKYGMREFAIYDNNGYILQFGQEIKDS